MAEAPSCEAPQLKNEAEVAASTPGVIAAAKAGDRRAVGDLLEASRNYLLMVATREIREDLKAKGGASDIVQDTFVDAHRDMARFQGSTETEFRAWLRRLLLNNVASFARKYRDADKRSVRREIHLAESDEIGEIPLPPAPEPSPSQNLMASEEQVELLQAMQRLPEHYRDVILWRHRDGLDYAEIAQKTGRTSEAVRKLWARGVELLQRELRTGEASRAGAR